MTLRITLLLAFVAFTIDAIYAQKWAEMLHESRANFYDIQAAFNEEWSGKDTVRGSGWKPYKRWEYDAEERVYPSGEFPPMQQLFTEYQKFIASKGRTDVSNVRSNGDWELIGPTSWTNQSGWNPGIGRVNFIYEEPGDEQVIYVGTPAGGLWRTEDGGLSWTPLTDNLPSMGVSGIAVDPNNTDIIYIATGDRDANDYNGVGVLKSNDYGQSWETTGMGWNISDGIKSNWLIMHPDDAETLFLACNEGLYKTENGADTWQLVLTNNIREVAFHPTDPDIVYAVSDRFYRSTNGGLDFEFINDGLPSSANVNRFSLAVSGDSPDFVYVLAGDDDDSGLYGIYRSTDQGLTFTERADGPNILGYSSTGESGGGQSWYDLALTVSPENGNRVITGGINVWRSEDGGMTSNCISHWVYPSDIGYTHADIHYLGYYGDRLYCGSDGGIFISYDDGLNWQDLSEGIGITQLYRMDFSEQDPYNILVGTQDNGTNFLTANSNFTHLLGGDGNGAEVNESNPEIMYAAYPNGSIQISNDSGDSFQSIMQDFEEDGLWVTPFVLDPSNQSVLYAGFSGIWKYTQFSGWEIMGNFGGSAFRFLAVAPSDNNYIYGSKAGTLFRTTDGGDNWDVISNVLPNLNITGIAVDESNPEHIIVTCSGYNDGEKVYESFDAGSEFENISYNLPNIPVNCVIFENSEEEGVYIGTDIGVFYTNNNLANWVDYFENLPKTTVRQLKISESIGKIRAGTYGRGIWESDLYTASDAPPVAGISSDVQVICVGESVQFYDDSYNAAPGWNWTIEGGTPSSSDERDPLVVFNEEGVYTVSLEVSNANGTDQTTQEQYIVVLGSGDVPPFFESFETISSLDENDWYPNNPDGDITFELNTTSGISSEQSVWINNFENGTAKIDELPSPVLDLTGAAIATLTFKVAYAQRNPLNNDRLRVYASNDCGDTWSIRGQWQASTSLPTAPITSEPFVPQGIDQWQEIEVDNITSAFFGPNFRFKFEFLSDNGNNFYIDDINLNISGVGIEETDKLAAEFELFPNPARGQTTLDFQLLQSAELSYDVMDASGRVIENKVLGQQPVGEHRFTIPTYEYARGLYLVRLLVDGQSITRKLFIE